MSWASHSFTKMKWCRFYSVVEYLTLFLLLWHVWFACVQDRELAQAELDGESHSHLHQRYIYYTEVSGLRGDRLKILFCVVSGELLEFKWTVNVKMTA